MEELVRFNRCSLATLEQARPLNAGELSRNRHYTSNPGQQRSFIIAADYAQVTVVTESRALVREKTTMFATRMVLLVLIVVCGRAWAADEFEGIKCGGDIPKALIGKRDSNEPVAAIEKRHRDLGLKNLGGDEISDRLFLASWQICGGEYELLVNTKTGLIRDVLPFPPHSAKSPMFIGACQAGGRESPGTIVAVLNNGAGYNARDEKLTKTMLKASAAWKIDESKEKFAQQATEGLVCPLGGVVTQDGGL